MDDNLSGQLRRRRLILQVFTFVCLVCLVGEVIYLSTESYKLSSADLLTIERVKIRERAWVELNRGHYEGYRFDDENGRTYIYKGPKDDRLYDTLQYSVTVMKIITEMSVLAGYTGNPKMNAPGIPVLAIEIGNHRYGYSVEEYNDKTRSRHIELTIFISAFWLIVYLYENPRLRDMKFDLQMEKWKQDNGIRV